MTAVALWTKHRGIAYRIAHDWFLPGADEDDVTQEALLALWVAARHHDPERGPFPPFAALVIRRHLITCVKRANQRGSRSLTDATRVLDDTAAPHTVEELADAREKVRRFTRAVTRLSAMERRAMLRCLDGAGPADKSDDNALQRAKAKVQLSLLGETP